jgi:hypothetical protein
MLPWVRVCRQLTGRSPRDRSHHPAIVVLSQGPAARERVRIPLRVPPLLRDSSAGSNPAVGAG